MTRSVRRLLCLLGLFMALSLVTRVGLSLWAVGVTGSAFSLSEWGALLGWGLGFDLVVAVCFALPWGVYEALVPNIRRASWVRLERLWAGAWALGYLGLWAFVAVSEFVFWGEFGQRFNFVAVDYLVYSQEVVRNIWESYPVGWWLLAMALGALLLWGLSWRRLEQPAARVSGFAVRGLTALAIGGFAAIGLQWLSPSVLQAQPNAVVRELGMNGVYAFFHALRHNQIDYPTFYPTLPGAQALELTRALLQQEGVAYTGADSVERDIPAGPTRRPLNVVLISVESLSADFMGALGDPRGLTPELDQLARQGLLFTNLYATGTRTVRGLEALSVGTPPTPGQSIVRRPDNADLQTLGGELARQGWSPLWIYGGYGVFDNMNAYFAGNHYQVVDRTDAQANGVAVHHENVWGIADEDLYTLALRQFDRAHAAGQRFFGHVMTTSNHRPYTFPEGRIPLPQKTREAAVQYTDWAIGDFMHRARQAPWFDDTLFVIVADHTAAAAGKQDLPPERYHIPMIWYAPAHVRPAEMPRLMSQIDIPPTLLGWLGLPYRSRFFGHDLFHLEPGRERAFIGTYQSLGLIRDGRLVTLGLRQAPQVQPVETARPMVSAGLSDQQLVREAIAWYQTASEHYTSGKLKAVETPGSQRLQTPPATAPAPPRAVPPG